MRIIKEVIQVLPFKGKMRYKQMKSGMRQGARVAQVLCGLNNVKASKRKVLILRVDLKDVYVLDIQTK